MIHRQDFADAMSASRRVSPDSSLALSELGVCLPCLNAEAAYCLSVHREHGTPYDIAVRAAFTAAFELGARTARRHP